MNGDVSKLAKEPDLKFGGCNGLAGSSPAVATTLALYSEYKKIYGPYTRADGRKIVILYDGNKRTARQYAKLILEVKLGRRLVGDETVDHIDGDFTNDDPANLRAIPLRENAGQASAKAPVIVSCGYCGEDFALSKDQRSRRAANKSKYCSRKCHHRSMEV